MTLTVDNIYKSFGRFPALAGVSLEARDGEFLALLGPSGSGKDDSAARARRPGGARPRPGVHGWDRFPEANRPRAAGRSGVPELRPVQAHDRGQETSPSVSRCALGANDLRARRSPRAWRRCWNWCRSRASAPAIRPSSPAANVSGWPWREPWPSSPACSCWTSPSGPLTRRCARIFAPNCAASTMPPTSRPCLSPTTRRRRWRSPTG